MNDNIAMTSTYRLFANVRRCTALGRSAFIVNQSGFETQLTKLRVIRCRSFEFRNLSLSFQNNAKRNRGKKSVDQSDLDEDEEEEYEDTDVGKDYKIITNVLPSTRLDTIAKAGFGISKSKIEKLFFEGRLRLNGEKITKKATTVKLGDYVDHVQGPSPHNPKFLEVSRCELVDVKENRSGDDVRLHVKLKRFKKLTIENYGQPWTEPIGGDSDEK